jgi:hypothetical protein
VRSHLVIKSLGCLFRAKSIQHHQRGSTLPFAQRAADVMFAGKRAGLEVLPMVVLCGCWWPVYAEVMVRRAGDDVLG